MQYECNGSLKIPNFSDTPNILNNATQIAANNYLLFSEMYQDKFSRQVLLRC